MPEEGFEPSRGCPHYALNVARLPIPPLRLGDLLYRKQGKCQDRYILIPIMGKFG